MRFTAEHNRVIEISFLSTEQYNDPYNDVDVDVVFAGPGGESLKVPAFWTGDNVWKVRFAGTESGEWTFETLCSNAKDKGLHAVPGHVSVRPYTGQNPVYAHGRLRIAADKRHFEQADGTPFFWTGDTWWMGLCSRLDWPHGFRALTSDRVAKGFNVVQIIAGPLPDMDAWDARGKNEAGHPFAEGFARINPAYYDHADLKIGHLVDSGIMPCIVGMWGYYLPQIGVPRIKRFWRYLVARYGAYPVVWCIAGEGKMSYYLSQTKEADTAAQFKGWTEVMASVRVTDGYHNLITIHPTQYGREQVEDPSLMDFEMLQTGHSGFQTIPNVIESVTKAVKVEPRMPIVNSEVNYEGILGGCWQDVQRLSIYHSILNGTAGHTYGANGIWQMSTAENPYGPSPHGRCWGNTPWQEAAQLPGSRQTGIAASFMRRFRWWEFEKHPEWIDPVADEKHHHARMALGVPRKLRVIYVPFCWDPPMVKVIERDRRYTAYFFDPCTGKEFPCGDVTADGEGNWRPPVPPEVHDWLLVLAAKP